MGSPRGVLALLILSLLALAAVVSVAGHENKTLDEGSHNATNEKDDNDGDEHEGDEHEGVEHEGLVVAGINYEQIKEPLIFTVVVLLAGASKIGYHHANFLSSKVPESCILIILGTIFGAVIHFTDMSPRLPKFFKPHEFFVFLLPPIILESSFSLYDRTFTDNLGSILLFAVLGTVIACAFVGLSLWGLMLTGAIGALELKFTQIMVFASLIVAVDPVAVLAVFNEIGVNRVLYFMVFGESLLNDGVTVVLYKVFQAYNVMDEINGYHIFLGIIKFFVVCLGGLVLGILAGVGSALLTKQATHVKVAQPLIIFTMAYLGFLMAEVFEFSGIISIVACGITQRNYAFNNISEKSRTTIKYFTKVISTASEIIIFLFLGLSIVNPDHRWHTGFTLWTVVLCVVYRFIIIFGLSLMINKLDVYRVRKIDLHEQFMIAYGGLRGAVCFSLVALLNKKDFPQKDMFVTTTLVVILFTVFVQGITIKPLVKLLQISLAPEKDRSMSRELNEHVTDHMMAGIEDIIGDHGKNHLHQQMEIIDTRYLQPWLMLEPDPADAQLCEFYEHLILKEHYNYLKLSGAKTANMPELDLEKSFTAAEVLELLQLLGPHVATELFLQGFNPHSSVRGHGPQGGLGQVGQGHRKEKMPSPVRTVVGGMQSPGGDMETLDVEMISPRRSSRSMSIGDSRTDPSAKSLRNLLVLRRNSHFIPNHDKNLTQHEGFGTEIQKKSNRNRQLKALFVEDSADTNADLRRKSWSEADAQLCTDRGSSRKKMPPRHAVSIDLGDTSRPGEDMEMRSISPGTLDSVFEEDEEGKEGNESRPMIPGEKRGKSKRLERQRAHSEEEAKGSGGEGDGDGGAPSSAFFLA